MSKIQIYIYIIFIAITAVILYVFFVMSQPSYESKISLLIIPQTELVASDINTVMENIIFVTQNIIDNNNLIDNIDNTAKIKVVQLSGTSIMQFIIQTDAISDINKIENTIVKKSLTEILKYYDINNDFAVKIVKRESVHKTIFSVVARYFVIFFIVIGLVAGLLALFYIIDFLQIKSKYDKHIDGKKIFGSYRSHNELCDEKKDIDHENIIVNDYRHNDDNGIKNEVRVTDSIINSETDLIHDATDNEVKTKKTSSKLHSKMPDGLPTTPNNLPVADVSDFGLKKRNDNSEEEDVQDIEEIIEPTEEELKARLNELLNGKL